MAYQLERRELLEGVLGADNWSACAKVAVCPVSRFFITMAANTSSVAWSSIGSTLYDTRKAY